MVKYTYLKGSTHCCPLLLCSGSSDTISSQVSEAQCHEVQQKEHLPAQLGYQTVHGAHPCL